MQPRGYTRLLALGLALTMTAALAGCSAQSRPLDQPTPPAQSQPAPDAGGASTAQPEPVPQPEPEPAPQPEPVPQPEPEPGPEEGQSLQPEGEEEGPYDFSQPVPEGTAVDMDYFADAVFIGDSRSDGFMIYSGVKGAENLTYNGLSIFKLESKKCFKRDGRQMTALEALGRKTYGKVYLSLGINELGYYDDKGYYNAYLKAIDDIRAIQPDAVIYLQGLIPLNEDVIRATGGASYLTNEHLLVYNDLMKQAAQEKQVAFLDLNAFFADETGALPAQASKDGIHLTKSYYQKWLEYLTTHTVTYQRLYGEDIT